MDNFTEKIDAMDLVITTLREHEKTLDEIVHRLDIITNKQSGIAQRCDLNSQKTSWKKE